MAKCVNCENDAVYTVKNEGSWDHDFCEADLPKMYNKLSLPARVTKIGQKTEYQIFAEAEAIRLEEEAEPVRAKARAKKKAEAEPVVVEEVPSEPTE